jgi:hypothetical protein
MRGTFARVLIHLFPWTILLLQKLRLVKLLYIFVWDPDVYYHVHKSCQLDPILNQLNSFQTLIIQSYETHFNIIFLFTPGILSDVIPFSFPITIFMRFLSSWSHNPPRDLA